MYLCKYLYNKCRVIIVEENMMLAFISVSKVFSSSSYTSFWLLFLLLLQFYMNAAVFSVSDSANIDIDEIRYKYHDNKNNDNRRQEPIANQDHYQDFLESRKQPPPMPLQFHAKIHLYAHQLPRNNTYPSYKTKMDVSYDYYLQRVKCIVHEGINKGKVYLRRYDERTEYMVKMKKKKNENNIDQYLYKEANEEEYKIHKSDPTNTAFTKCIRSYLGESMPKFELKHSALPNNQTNFIYQGTGPLASMNNVILDEEDDKQYLEMQQNQIEDFYNNDDPTLVDYYTTSSDDNPFSRYDLYISTHTQLPQRIVDFSVDPKTKKEKMIMTYNFVHISTPQFPLASSSSTVGFDQCIDSNDCERNDFMNTTRFDADYISDGKHAHLASTTIYDIERYGFKYEDCDWHVGGFPYIHAFLYFLRF